MSTLLTTINPISEASQPSMLPEWIITCTPYKYSTHVLTIDHKTTLGMCIKRRRLYTQKMMVDNNSPPARWGLLDFIRAVLLLLRLRILLLLVLLLLAVQIPGGTAGPPLRAPDPSGHCRTSTGAPDPSGHCRTSTASSRSQWALPDLNRDFQIAVGTAGPQPRLPDRSGHCRTSTATSRSQWHCRTSTAR